MKQEIKDKWVEALRSGDYEQGFGHLCKDGKYCCLGVLCEINDVPSEPSNVVEGVKLYDGNVATLSYEVMKKLGLNAQEVDMLALLNDGNPSRQIPIHGFTAIAYIIENYINTEE